jgi:hypothetical protein
VVTDLLVWKNNIMTADNFDFRLAWLTANLHHQLLALNAVNVRMAIAQYHPLLTQQHLKQVYLGDFGYEKEGLLFVHQEAPYLHAVNQNVMIWKDSHTSKYPIDNQPPNDSLSSSMETSEAFVYGVGRLDKKGSVYLADGYKIGEVGPSSMDYVPHGYVRFRTTGVSLTTEN